MITVNTKDLREALQFVGKALPRKSTLSILEFARLVAENNELKVRAANLELQAERRIPATGALPAILLPHDKLLAAVMAAKSETIEISDDSNVKVGTRKYVFEKGDPADYPAFPEAGKPLISLTESISPLLARIAPAASREVARYALHGLLFEISAQGLNILASDGKRMHKARMERPDDKKFQSVIVPTSVMPFLSKMSLPLTISFNRLRTVKGKTEDPTLVFFQNGSSLVSARIPDGTWPNWRNAWPKDRPTVSVEFKADALVDEVNALSIVNAGRGPYGSPPQLAVRFVPRGLNVMPLSISVREASANTEIAATCIFDMMAFGVYDSVKLYLNPDHMVEAVRAVTPGKDAVVRMDYRAPADGRTNGVVFSSEGSPVEVLVMPQGAPDEK